MSSWGSLSLPCRLSPPSVTQGVGPRSHHYAPKSMWQKLLGEKAKASTGEIINLDLSSGSFGWLTFLSKRQKCVSDLCLNIKYFLWTVYTCNNYITWMITLLITSSFYSGWSPDTHTLMLLCFHKCPSAGLLCLLSLSGGLFAPFPILRLKAWEQPLAELLHLLSLSLSNILSSWTHPSSCSAGCYCSKHLSVTAWVNFNITRFMLLTWNQYVSW